MVVVTTSAPTPGGAVPGGFGTAICRFYTSLQTLPDQGEERPDSRRGSGSRPEQCERGPGVGDGCAAAQPVGRSLEAESCARRAGIAAQGGQRAACLLGKRPVAAGE